MKVYLNCPQIILFISNVGFRISFVGWRMFAFQPALTADSRKRLCETIFVSSELCLVFTLFHQNILVDKIYVEFSMDAFI